MAAINQPYAGAPRTGALQTPAVDINRWIVLAVFIAGVSALLPVLQNSSVTSRGFDLQSIEQEKLAVLGEISLIETDVARLTSLPRIERRAEEIGLIPSFDPHYVSVDVAGPAPAKIPAEFLPGPAEQSSGSAPWWRSLLDWLAPLN